MPDRRHLDASNAEFRALVSERLDQGSRKMQGLEEALRDNTHATQRVEKNTQEIVDFFESLKGAVKVLNVLAKLARPLTAIILFCSALWGALALFIKRGP